MNASTKKSSLHRRTKIIVSLLPVALLLWLINNNFVLTPTISYNFHPGSEGSWAISPVDLKQVIAIRSKADHRLHWQLARDKVSFQASVPRIIQGIRLKFQFGQITAPVVAVTVKGKTKGSDAQSIIRHQALDALDWPHHQEGPITIWQRPRPISIHQIPEEVVTEFDTLATIRATKKNSASIGTVGLDRFFTTEMADRPVESPLKSPIALLGSHQIVMYTDQGIDLSFAKRDLNQAKGKDDLRVTVWSARSLLSQLDRVQFSQVLKDDTNLTNNRRPGNPETVRIHLPDAPAGVYYVLLEANDDVMIQSITSRHQYLNFLGQVRIAETQGSASGSGPIQFTTNSSVMNIVADTASGQQRIRPGNRSILLRGIGQAQTFINLFPTTQISLERGGVTLSRADLTAVSPFQLFSSNGGTNIALSSPVTLSHLDYLMAEYTPQSTPVTFEKTYALNDLLLTTHSVHATVESPGMQASNTTVELKKVTFTLVRGPFPWAQIRRSLDRLLSRL